jgi:hypothetical protein
MMDPMWRKYFFAGILIVLCCNGWTHLKISTDKRHLVKKDGSPFFWLGDTAWELFHHGWWFNPRDGRCIKLGEFDNTGSREFVPTSVGRGSNWVLVLDDASKNYPEPNAL